MRYIEESAAYEQFDLSLLEVYGTVDICGTEYDAYRVLKKLDPIAYRCHFADWLDAEDLTTDESEADEDTEDDEDWCPAEGCLHVLRPSLG